ncbi:hypothetical protein QBC38DRAFT_129685 [Podospora fimiseda]|uniref:Uncharacterized protein n=1 Tax=Podospora fimiseda TaxID=252190 RepID=A0AAN6YN53_9PEZI|nr:hypothetical protein QBC38DRAFT_129685 [Podospora fimiseda]
MSSNRVQRNTRKKLSSTTHRRIIIEYTEEFGFAMPMDCSRCLRLRLSDCKATARSGSCQNCLKANVSCNIFGEPEAVLRNILKEKRRLDQEKKETFSKLLRLEAQSRALEAKADEAFGREIALLQEEEAEEEAESSTVTREPEFPISGGDHNQLSFGDVGNLDFSGDDWSSLDPGLLSQVGLGSAGGTAGASPDSLENRQVPTS